MVVYCSERMLFGISLSISVSRPFLFFWMKNAAKSSTESEGITVCGQSVGEIRDKEERGFGPSVQENAFTAQGWSVFLIRRARSGVARGCIDGVMVLGGSTRGVPKPRPRRETRWSSRKCPNDFVIIFLETGSPSFLDTQTQERAPMLHGVVAALLCAYAPQLMLQATSDAQSAMAAATAAAGVYHATVTSMGVDATSTTEAMKAAASVYHSAAEFNVPSALEAVSAAASVYSAHGGDLLGDNAAAAAVTPSAVQVIGMGKSWLPGVKVPLLDAYDMALRDSPFATKVVTVASLPVQATRVRSALAAV